MKSNELYWDFLPNFNNKYVVSRDGRIVSLNYNGTNEIKELSQFLQGDYLAVKLTKNGKSIHYFIHKAVAETFIPNPNNYPEINHKSGIKTENFVKNLEWCNRSQNIKHAYDTGLKVAPSGKDHIKSTPVNMFDLDMNFIKSFISYTECCEYLKKNYNYTKVQPSYISRVVLGKRKKYKDFTFRKAEEFVGREV